MLIELALPLASVNAPSLKIDEIFRSGCSMMAKGKIKAAFPVSETPLDHHLMV